MNLETRLDERNKKERGSLELSDGDKRIFIGIENQITFQEVWKAIDRKNSVTKTDSVAKLSKLSIWGKK